MFKWIVVPCLVLIPMTAAPAAVIIDVGDHNLVPQTPGQQFSILVSGGDPVEGVDLLLQMGDGGSVLGGVDGSAPRITGVTLIAGNMVFSSSNTGDVFPDPPTDMFWQISTTTDVPAASTVPAQGVLALVTVDTTGFRGGGVFTLKAGDIQASGGTFDSTFAGVPATINNGTITIVPEPGGVTIAGMAGLLLLRRRQWA